MQNRKSNMQRIPRVGESRQSHQMTLFWIFDFRFSIGGSNRKKVFALAICALLFAFSHSAEAQQQPKKTPRIGYLASTSAAGGSAILEDFRQGLREFGYIEGRTISIEYRWAEGKLDRLPILAADLVNSGVDVIVTTGTPPVLAAKQATRTIPIVAANADNLVELGVVSSLARPGENVTGSTRVDADFSVKRLEILKETLPKLSHLAVLSHGVLGGDQEELKEIQATARLLGIQIHSFTTQEPGQFPGAYAEMLKRRADALIFFTSAFTSFHRQQLVNLAIMNRLPTMCSGANWVDVGCVMSYGPNVRELYRRSAVFVDKILKGTKPADIPVEQPTKFELVINLKTAKQIGLVVPPNVLARADRVIR
jgi:putative ABC transport system substrate-binding protein